MIQNSPLECKCREEKLNQYIKETGILLYYYSTAHKNQEGETAVNKMMDV